MAPTQPIRFGECHFSAMREGTQQKHPEDPLKRSEPIGSSYRRGGNEKARRGGRASLSRIAPTKLCFVFVDAIGFRIEEVFRTQRVFVDAVDRVDRGEFFALGLALCLFGRTGNVQLDVNFDFGMNPSAKLSVTSRLSA